MKFLVVVTACITVLSITASLALAKKAEPEICKKWISEAFFEKAGPKQVRVCLEAGRRLDQRDSQGRTVLHHAARVLGKQASVVALLHAGADPNLADKKGRTPLHVAAGAANVYAVSLLLLSKADLSARDRNGKTALHHLVHGYFLHPIVKYENMTIRGEAAYLKSLKLDVPSHRETFDQMTHVFKETAQLLLHMDADPKLRDGNGESPCEFMRNKFMSWMKNKSPVNVPSILPSGHNYRRHETPFWPRSQFSFLVIADKGWPDGRLMRAVCDKDYYQWAFPGLRGGLLTPSMGIDLRRDES